MRRRRVTGRFFVFLAVVVVAALLIVRQLFFSGPKVSQIMMANASQEQSVDCVLIRDEHVMQSESAARVEYIAQEDSLVSSGDVVANVYATGYSENLLTSLEATRSKIQVYHKQLLSNIVDADLNRLDKLVDMMALEFKNLITHQTVGDLATVTAQLQTAMVKRQEYLRQNKRADNKLTKLYEEENARLGSIQAWRKVSTADRDGLVSFYLDGYESDLTPAVINTLTIQDVRAVLSGTPLTATQDIREKGVCRIVDQNNWYVAVLIEGNVWTPMVGQDNYYMMMDGFDDLSYTAAVTSVQKENGVTLAIFQIKDPIGPLIYRRTGRARFSITLQGLAVRTEALSTESGQVGVWVYDVPGGTFVPVEVLSTNGSLTMIQPLSEGALQLGQTILIKKK